MHKRWVLKPTADASRVKFLAEALQVNRIIAELLVQRGITSFDEAKAFFRPELSHLHDPYLMKDMHKAVDRILKAMQAKEKILVYGDYDVDGTTAVSLVYMFLVESGIDTCLLDFYIPDRYSEGYGISTTGIDFAAAGGFSLVIALDCGIKAIEKIQYANSLGVDFIICDHHRPGDTIPDAIAVLDPKRNDCEYPYKELSGCGVGFKLIQAIALRKNISFSSLHKYLDLVAVSIASDIVPITGENRILAAYGLRSLNKQPRPCFEEILKYANVIRKNMADNTVSAASDNLYLSDECFFCRELSISDLVFLIGPRINAAGRIESGRNAVRLLISKNTEEANELANQINEFNTTRRDLDLTTTDMALESIRNLTMQNAKATVVYNPEWHKGVIGIVASRLIESYYKPTIVLTKSNGLITGSARSIKDFDIYDAIDECSNLLEHFGGHKYAAGLSLKPENLDAFISKFQKVAAERITDDMTVPEVEIDLKITLDEISPRLIRILKQFAPFGPGNPSPVFQTDGVLDNGHGRLLKNKHLKLTIGHKDYPSNPYPAIGFSLGDHYEHIQKGEGFNICYHIEENEWNNKKEIQINIKDIMVQPEVEAVAGRYLEGSISES